MTRTEIDELSTPIAIFDSEGDLSSNTRLQEYIAHRYEKPYYFRHKEFNNVVDKIGLLGYTTEYGDSYTCIFSPEGEVIVGYTGYNHSFITVSRFCKWYNDKQGWL